MTPIIYEDKHGQRWTHVDGDDYVYRLSDGSQGLWDDGKGLTRLPNLKYL